MNVTTTICFILMIGLLGGCGVKPKNLEPPPGSEKTEFPRTYPNPATDPVMSPAHKRGGLF